MQGRISRIYNVHVIKNLLLFLLIFLLSIRVITDSDFGWHVRVGEYIVNTKSIPKTDLFSFSQPDYPYVYHSWASEILIYLSYKLGDLTGSSLLFAAITTASLFFIFATVRYISPTFNLNFLLLSTLLINSIAGGRTRAFGFLFIAILQFFFIKFSTQNSKIIWVTPLLFIAWVNFHGSFILGILVLLMMSVLTFQKSRQKAKIMLAITALSTTATLVNPYFTRAWQQAINMSISSFALKNINTDWISLVSEKTTGWIFAGLVIAILLLIFFKKLPVEKNYKYLVTTFLILSVISSRFAIALLAFFIPLTSQSLEIFKKSLSKPILNSLPIKFSTLSVLLILILYAIANLFEINFAYQSFKNYSEYMQKYAPQKVNFAVWPYKANQYLNENYQDLRIISDANWGGFMLLISPKTKLFYYGAMDNFIIDGRSFVFEYLDIANTQPGYEEKLNKYGINAVFLPKAFPITDTLKQNTDWQTAYDDEKAIILIKR